MHTDALEMSCFLATCVRLIPERRSSIISWRLTCMEGVACSLRVVDVVRRSHREEERKIMRCAAPRYEATKESTGRLTSSRR